MRRELEPFLAGAEPGRVVVYVPLAQEETHNALVEVEKAGYVMKLSLAGLASEALKPFFGVKGAALIEKQEKAEHLNLEELDEQPTPPS